MAPNSLRRLHRAEIRGAAAVTDLLERAREANVPLQSGMDHRNRLRTASILSIRANEVHLSARNIDPRRHPQIYFSFDLDRSAYFFAAEPYPDSDPGSFSVHLPAAIYEAERRVVPRSEPIEDDSPRLVEVEGPRGWRCTADVVDSSYSGIALIVSSPHGLPSESPLRVRFLDGQRAGELAFGYVRHRSWHPQGDSRLRLGLELTQVPLGQRLPVDRRDRILDRPGPQRAWRQVSLAGALARTAPSRIGTWLGVHLRKGPPIEVIEYLNEKGQPLTAIVDRAGESRGAPAVVIPPAWGRTKETLLPLALTLVKTFERARESLTVIRFDGTQRRGEAFVDPMNREPGDESINFTFSQAARDIHSTIKLLKEDERFQASRVVLVTFSLAAIDGRRAVALDPTGILTGWVSVVGMADVQSGLKAVSGGIDYVYGAQQGVAFGVHELGGVKVHIDRAAQDVLQHHLGSFEDARRDMAALEVPVTWIHGRHDAWMDVKHVQELLSAGDTGRRRLIEVPTGHQLRNSWEALQTFQLVAEEVSEMLIGRRFPSVAPDLARLEAQQRAERARRPSAAVNVRRFWRDYLVGRDNSIGFELLTATSGYRRFMGRQIDLLRLHDDDRILDLGCGTGDFEVLLAERRPQPGLHVIALDFVTEGLIRARGRLAEANAQAAVQFAVANLDAHAAPLRSSSFDAVLASLLISYVSDPGLLLNEAFRLLRPGGRLVLSAPRRDADLSKLYIDMMSELSPDRVQKTFGIRALERFEAMQRGYLNEAARLVTLEETGQFQFRDPKELATLVHRAGFRGIDTELALGDPPQAALLSATKP